MDYLVSDTGNVHRLKIVYPLLCNTLRSENARYARLPAASVGVYLLTSSPNSFYKVGGLNDYHWKERYHTLGYQLKVPNT